MILTNRRQLITGLIDFTGIKLLARTIAGAAMKLIRPVGIACANIYGSLQVGDWITFLEVPVRYDARQFIVTWTGGQICEIAPK